MRETKYMQCQKCGKLTDQLKDISITNILGKLSFKQWCDTCIAAHNERCEEKRARGQR